MILCLSVYAARKNIFDKIVFAIENQIPKIELQRLEAKYKNAHIRGKGYIVSITKNISGDTIVNIATKKDPALASSVGIIVFLRKAFARKIRRFKRGNSVRFSGVFKEIRMNAIVVDRGIIKRY